MLRFVLETCRSVPEAIAALCRVPVAQSQNVMLLDRTGDHATLFLGPDREPAVTRLRTCTNHQETVSTASGSALRQRELVEALEASTTTLSSLVARFLKAPLYSLHVGFTTAYTAVYRPEQGRVDYLWPGRCWSQSFERFDEGSYTHNYGELIQ